MLRHAKNRFGAKRIFAFAVFVFMLGSFLCATSPTLRCMVAARIVQGVGGALVSAFRGTFVCIGALGVVTGIVFDQLPPAIGRGEKSGEAGS